MPADAKDFKKPAALHAYLSHGAEGNTFQTGTYVWEEKSKQWASANDLAYFTYWPAVTDKAGRALVETGKLKPRSWHNRRLRLRIEADRRHIALWLDGRLVRQLDRPTGSKGPVAFQLQ